MDYNLFWTDEAIDNFEGILKYLERRWTSREINNFKERLRNQLDIILKFPLIFPQSQRHPRLPKAVLSKQTIVFYEIKDKTIYIVYLFDSRQDPSKVK